jgi:3-oxoacyl-[acyl-carrier protein] reductase
MSTTLSTRPVAIVTGGAGGIGSAISTRLAADGLHVVVVYNQSEAAAHQLVAGMRAAGHAASAVACDVTHAAEVDKLFTATLAQHGRVDVVVNNAGTMVPRPLVDASDENYDMVFNVNVRGALNLLRQASRHLHDGGRIVNISSTLVQAPIAGAGLYAASKAALELLGQASAKELGPRGITVNALRVGPTVPGMFSKAPPERQAAMAAASPFKRLGQPRDVADAVAFLVSDGGRWITGQTITVDGGST